MLSRLFGAQPKTRRETISPLQSFDEGYMVGRNETEFKWMLQLFDLSKQALDLDKDAIVALLQEAASKPLPRLRPADPFAEEKQS